MHLTDEQLNEYLDNEIHDRASVEMHLTTCADCAARLSVLQELFAEINSLPDVELTHSLAARFAPSPVLPAALPRSLTLTVGLQTVLAIIGLVFAAPFALQWAATYVSLSLPPLTDWIAALQSQWLLWLDTLSTFQFPSIPEIPVMEVSSLVTVFVLIGAFLMWLIGNGLLLRNQLK